MNLSYKNRIALHYMLATAIIMGLVSVSVYFIMQNAIYRHLDKDLAFEAKKHTSEIRIIGDSIKFINKEEWEEQEHREIQVNPVFIQIIDAQGQLMDKSPNLKEASLPFNKEKFGGHFNASLNGKDIRQVQLPIELNGKIKGYILSAISSESEEAIILRLRNVLLISFLFVLGGLYFISRFLAGRSIIPIKNITQTIQRITKNNLNERVKLPNYKDEIFELSSGFNNLLQRIEDAMKRERQFTSDASHELRTPLASLRGTLEVLIRKPRAADEYKESIVSSLVEIDRMTTTIEQLLLLARLENESVTNQGDTTSLATIIDETLLRYKDSIFRKKLKVELDIRTKYDHVPHYYSNLIVDNIINNAIKYMNENNLLKIIVFEKDSKIKCVIEDNGIGIKKEDLDYLFDRFYRSDALNHKQITGNGLGLSIVKKSADAIHAKTQVESTLGRGTTFTITF